jgi:hypothetical protein
MVARARAGVGQSLTEADLRRSNTVQYFGAPLISQEVADAIAKRAEVLLRPASDDALAHLAVLELPMSVVDFYRRFEPSTYAEIADIRLWPIPDILAENRDYVPGADLFPHGLVVFASTTSGDAYCFDICEAGPPVVLMSHELIFADMTLPQIKALRKRVAPDFDTFLQMFADGSLETQPIDEPPQ